jgi:hypothetical protein
LLFAASQLKWDNVTTPRDDFKKSRSAALAEWREIAA